MPSTPATTQVERQTHTLRLKMDMQNVKREMTTGLPENPLQEKSMEFAVRIVSLSRTLRDECKEYALADQVLRSGTSIGANLAEAAFATSKKDFLVKAKIALKECSETRFWLKLLIRSKIFPKSRLSPLLSSCTELLRMLVSTCKTTEERLKSP